jgi:hypothetical protein
MYERLKLYTFDNKFDYLYALQVVSAVVDSALYQMDVPALSYIYAAYGKSGLISNGKE